MAFKSSIRFKQFDIKKIRRELAKLQKTEVKWGWINHKKYPMSDKNGRGGVYVASIATANNFGGYAKGYKTNDMTYIPARPYFEQAIEMSKQFNELESEAMFHRVLCQLPYKHILKGIGDTNAEYIKKSIAMQNMAKLSPKAIAIKGNSQQWDDTGLLIRSISASVKYVRNVKGG